VQPHTHDNATACFIKFDLLTIVPLLLLCPAAAEVSRSAAGDIALLLPCLLSTVCLLLLLMLMLMLLLCLAAAQVPRSAAGDLEGGCARGMRR
jgi:hypothetical protein